MIFHFIKQLALALAGRRLWLKLKRKYGIDNGLYAVLLPEDDCELNACAIRNIDKLVKHRKAKGVLLITKYDFSFELGRNPNVIATIALSESKIDKIMAFHEMYNFSERILVVSLTKPFGSNLYKAQDIKELTLDDLVCLSIYLVREWVGA